MRRRMELRDAGAAIVCSMSECLGPAGATSELMLEACPVCCSGTTVAFAGRVVSRGTHGPVTPQYDHFRSYSGPIIGSSDHEPS
jgi:hypothetical protein